MGYDNIINKRNQFQDFVRILTLPYHGCGKAYTFWRLMDNTKVWKSQQTRIYDIYQLTKTIERVSLSEN